VCWSLSLWRSLRGPVGTFLSELRANFVALYGFVVSSWLSFTLFGRGAVFWLDSCSGPLCQGEFVFLWPECRSVLYLGCRRCCAPLRPELVSLIKKTLGGLL
jgi:hypothetical protein